MPDMSTAKSGQVLVRTLNDGIPSIVSFSMPPPNGWNPHQHSLAAVSASIPSTKSGQVLVRTLLTTLSTFTTPPMRSSLHAQYSRLLISYSSKQAIVPF